ncbi:rod shape-determining protein MreB [Nitrincola sp. MINF-07-Sa-05]|uniref:rod shape-determining protein MreB n=1 Tax=Nitrincola salilacus TaxID=3400273 RepID=UPI003918445C
MIKKFFDSFSTTLYLQVWEHRIKVTDVSTGRTFDEVPNVKIVTNAKGEKIIAAIGNQANNTQEPNAVVVNPFSHPRTLLNDFLVAEKFLQEAFKTLLGKKLFSPAPAVVIQLMEKTEGGLTLIEIRAFKELALGAGARRVAVHQGDELSPRTIRFDQMVEAETSGLGTRT